MTPLTCPRHAVILAAGMGSRLRPITESVPKCLTEVHGRPILWHQLAALDACRVDRVTIVVGFAGRAVIDAIGDRFGTMEIEYRWNHDFATTNSMYSAWLARDVIAEGSLLLEGDVMIGPDTIRRALENHAGRSVWLAGHFGPTNDGSMSTTDADGRIMQIRIVREKLASYPANNFKSAGILSLQADYGRQFAGWLDAEVQKGNTNVYYDLVLAAHIGDAPLFVSDIDAIPWFEIDTIEDLRVAEKLFERRKHVIVVMDGAADLPIPSLGGKTPLQAARTPTLDRIARQGRTGLMSTMYAGVPIDSITGNLGILGYDPPRYYPFGRSSFEALAQDIFLDENDIAFRCNLISLDAENRIEDFTAGQIPTDITVKIIDSLRFAGDDIELYSGQSYRNILVLRNAGFLARDVVAAAPHQNMGRYIDDIMLRAESAAAKPVVDRLNGIMRESIAQVRKARAEVGGKADMIWLWSPSAAPRMPSFTERTGQRGAIVAGLDFVRGIGVATGMATKEIHGATGYLDTSYREKLRYAKNYLLHNDFLFLHVNAPDEEGHAGRPLGKIEAIENIDREILGPLLEFLEQRFEGRYRMIVLPDHYTCCCDAQHLDTPVPYAVCGEGVEPDSVTEYSEAAVGAVHKDPSISTRLVQRLIGAEAF